MKQLTDQDVRQIVRDEMQQNYRAGAPFIPPHTHNGNDGLRLNARDIVPNNKYLSGLIVTEPGGTGSITNGIFNPSKITFYGIARTPTSGTATTKCVLNGEAQLGNCFELIPPQIVPDANNVIQANTSSTFTKVAGAWVPTVNEGSTYMVEVYDGSFSLVGYIDIVSWTNTSINFNSYMAPGWTIIGNIIVT